MVDFDADNERQTLSKAREWYRLVCDGDEDASTHVPLIREELSRIGVGAEVLDTTGDHASYAAHWLKVLKDDKRAIFSAASHATKAVDFLHGLQPQPAE